MNLDYSLIFSSMRSTITVIASLVLLKYYIYLVVAPFYLVKLEKQKLILKRKIKSGQLPKTYHPKVSIIIPAWNEEVGIVTTILSALNNTYDNIEVIVVDDGSTDKTALVVTKFINQYNKSPLSGKNIRFYSQKNSGKAIAMNHGIKKATGEIVMTMDADSAHRKNAVSNMVNHFRDPQLAAVVGNVQVTNTQTLVGMIQKLEYIFGFYFKRVHSLFNAEYIFGGACAGFRKSLTFDSIGVFDDSTKTEDIEYSMRTQLYGLKSIYAEDVVAYTEGASTLSGLYKQRLRWKKGRLDVFKKYKELFFSMNKKHSKFMSWLVLPYAAFGDMQLLFEPMFFTLIWAYTLISGDYLSLGISSLFIFFTFISAVLFGDRSTNKLYFLLFPSFWLIFYVLVAVEFMALLKAIELVLSRQDVVWQRWQRQGLGIKLNKLATS
jgi:poly-beta-1,6-N-acetyl-D-glucosamine synthase